MMEHKSIFELERRKNFALSFKNWLNDIRRTSVDTASGYTYYLEQYLDYCIKYWPYRNGANSIENYLEEYNIDLYNLISDCDYISTCELYINLLCFACLQNYLSRDVSYYKTSTVDMETDRLLENADSILEQCLNMKTHRIEVEGGAQKY